MSKRIFAILAMLCACLGAAQAQDQPEVFTQLGHSSLVNSVAFSPDGSLLAAGGADNTIELWDVASGRELRTLPGHSRPVGCVAFSPDGKLLASGSDDGAVKLWDVASGRALPNPSAHSNSSAVTSIAFSSDGKTLASAAVDGVKFWDVPSGKDMVSTINLADLVVQHPVIQSVAFSPVGHILAEVRANGTVDIRDVPNNALPSPVTTLAGSSVAFSRDARMLAVGGTDGTVTVWDTASWTKLHTASKQNFSATSVAIARDGRVLAADVSLAGVLIWDVSSATEPFKLSISTHQIAFSPDGTLLATGDYRQVRLWNVANGRELPGLTGRSSFVSSVAFSPDGHLLASGSWDGKVRLWDVASGHEVLPSDGQQFGSGQQLGEINCIAFSRDGTKLAAGSGSNKIVLWNRASGNLIRTLAIAPKEHPDEYRSIAFSRDGSILASSSTISPFPSLGERLSGKPIPGGDGDSPIKLWNVASGLPLRTLDGAGPVAFSPDGSVLATGNTLWNTTSWNAIRTLSGPAGDSVAFSPPDGHMLASPAGATVNLWDVATGSPLPALSGSSDSIYSVVAFSADGRTLAAGSRDGKVTLWDVRERRVLQTLSGHPGQITAVAFSRDGQMLASASADGAVRLWSAPSGSERVSLIGFNDGSWLSITPEGYYDASSATAEQNLNVRIGDRVFPIASYRDKFFRPDLVKLSLAGNSLREHGFASIGSVKAAPIVELPDMPASANEPNLTVRVRITDGGGGIGEVLLFQNGAALPPLPHSSASGPGPITLTYTLQLVRGDNVLWAEARSADSEGMRSSSHIVHVSANFLPPPRGILHAVVVGIQKFNSSDPDSELPNAAPDAKSVADALRTYAKPLFQGEPDITLLITGASGSPDPLADTSRASVINALQKMQKSVGPNDAFVFYVASHGEVADGKYFLITSNVRSSDVMKSEALSQDDLTPLLLNIKTANKLVLIDTCQAGGEVNSIQKALSTGGMNPSTSAIILARDYGVTVLAAAATDEEARDGLFAHELVQGLTGQNGVTVPAPVDNDGTVDTSGLAHYVQMEVQSEALNKYQLKQNPVAEPAGPLFSVTKVK